jgi:glycerol transport system ATP-binding protein
MEPGLRVVDGPVWLRVASPETVYFSNDERIAVRAAGGA